MKIHDEFSGTITLTENSSRELLKVLKEQDEAFINDMLDGRCGFTLKSADGRSVELVPKADRPQGEFTKREYEQFLHGISLSLLSKRSAQHWGYEEETAQKIRWLEALEQKVRAKMKGADDGADNI